MEIRGTIIEDTFAEAFRMWASRLIVTAIDREWVEIAAREACGYGTSVIGCDAEVGVERWLDPGDTPDGRPGVALLFFAFHADKLGKALPNRVGQCLMTCPTTAVFDGMPEVTATEDSARIPVGARLRFFGDGHQKSKVLSGRRYWRVPVMDGEFVCEDSVGAVKAIGGGNFLVCGTDQKTTLAATRRAVEAIAPLPGVITPFPGGVVRSGSKVGSRYKSMFASTNDEYCPTLRSRGKSKLRDGTGCVYEVVVNGLNQGAIAHAMRVGFEAACGQGVLAISAGNYGGNLGKFHFRLREAAACNPPYETGIQRVQRGRYFLRWKAVAPIPTDGSFLRPDTLASLEPAALAATPVRVGRSWVRLEQLFDIEGGPGDGLSVFGAPPLDWCGAGMQSGDLWIEGNAGDDLGASMRGGSIRVGGNAGSQVGGPLPGSDRGMVGGHIVIDGDASDYAGLRMRRGVIAVKGKCGKSPGYRMLAGTILVGTGPLDYAGVEMRRGTIINLDAEHAFEGNAAFAAEGVFDSAAMPVARLLLKDMKRHGWVIDPAVLGGRYRLFSGDRFELGKGEIWQWVD